MVAVQRSNVTIRQEKGIGPIALPRLIIAGGVLGFNFLFGSRLIGMIPGFTLGIIMGIVVLILTQPIAGMPFYKYALRTIYGWATIAAIKNEGGILQKLAQVIQAQPEEGILRSESEFNFVDDLTSDDVLDEDWAYLGGFQDAQDHGLAIID